MPIRIIINIVAFSVVDLQVWGHDPFSCRLTFFLPDCASYVKYLAQTNACQDAICPSRNINLDAYTASTHTKPRIHHHSPQNIRTTADNTGLSILDLRLYEFNILCLLVSALFQRHISLMSANDHYFLSLR
jgi:hypothetical protein